MQLNLRLGAERDDADAFARVAECARTAGARRGLVHASCLVDDGANACAPLFIWRSEGAMRCFLLSAPFKSVINTYGRPRVRTWNVLEFDRIDDAGEPGFAVCEFDSVDSETSPWLVARREGERHRGNLDHAGLVLRASAFDPERWEIGRFSLWRDASCAVPPDADCVHNYRVSRCDDHASLQS